VNGGIGARRAALGKWMDREFGENAEERGHPVRVAARFAADFSRFAGGKGVGGLAAVIASAALESVALILVVPLLAVSVGGLPTGSWIEAALGRLFALLHLESQLQRLTFLLCALAAVMMARVALGALRDVLLLDLQIRFVDAQRTGIVRRFAETRWEVVAGLQQARVGQLVSADVQRIGQATLLLRHAVVAIVLLIAQFLAAFVLSPPMAVLCLAMLATGFAASFAVLRRAQGIGENVSDTNLSVMNTLIQFFGGLKLAVSQDLETHYVGEMEEALRNLAARQMQFARFLAGRQLASGVMAATIGAAIAWIGLNLLAVAPATLIGLLLILMRMIGPATTLQQVAQQLAQALPAYRAIQELEAELAAAARETAPTADRPAPLPVRGDVEFRHVDFAYARSGGPRPALSDCSVTIPAGCFVGITGPSGAGKTTFVDLLVGLVEPSAGEVLIDGTALRGATLRAWRRQISYVAQDPYLFYDSIRRNLLWANPEAGEDSIWEALETTGADDFVRAMPGGLDAAVGERGTLISGGERQRLAIARALIRRPRLLILDEATNAIDVDGESRLVERLTRLAQRPTIVMIAHREQSLDRCERLLVLRDGRLAG